MGVSVQGLVAGLGLGGLAVSLAAKDLLANLFGGLAIVTEKHFTIGDWIETPTVEGTVEGITFRSTLVRTFDQALVTVPNSILANEAIKNWSKMGKRRITYHLGISPFTPREKIQRAVQRIREMLQNHPDIHPQTIFVYFERFGESSLDLFLYFFTKTTVWGEYLQVEDCNLKILQILEEEGIELAFPAAGSTWMRCPTGGHKRCRRKHRIMGMKAMKWACNASRTRPNERMNNKLNNERRRVV